MSKAVLITGGIGFIGFHLTKKLLALNYKVTILDNLSEQIHTQEEIDLKLAELNTFDGFKFVQGDVRSQADCAKALQGVYYVFHLAAETGTGQSMYEIAKYVDVNVNGTAVLLDTIAKHNFPIKRIVLSSSRSVYGEGKYKCENHGLQYPTSRNTTDLDKHIFNPLCAICCNELQVQPTTEDSLINPLSVYATTKRQQEDLINYASTILNIPTSIFRYQNVYGVGQSLQNPYTGILSIFSTRIRNGKPIEIFEDGEESRDFVYIDDVVNATILPLLHPSENNEIINVGTGIATSVYTVAKEIMKILNLNVELIITGKSRAGDIRHNIADIQKLNNIYNFKPAYSFKQGLSEFITWVNLQDLPTDNYENAILELKQKGLYK